MQKYAYICLNGYKILILQMYFYSLLPPNKEALKWGSFAYMPLANNTKKLMDRCG